MQRETEKIVNKYGGTQECLAKKKKRKEEYKQNPMRVLLCSVGSERLRCNYSPRVEPAQLLFILFARNRRTLRKSSREPSAILERPLEWGGENEEKKKKKKERKNQRWHRR
ncbi:hypothetical protein CEXT_474891 [Caerostris extrusa]|uniref:Uncharacterized protein n=1 Tax=Caerostris extrusa TaxID=172846 RepID=A0AAV4UFA8_CAEEX|nr:hypothetical protein CEXT_474891 [Caerostris extrusa]